MDPALILTLLLDMANSHERAADPQWDSLVFVLWDIIKAYPSTQRHLAWKLFHKLGVPPGMLRVLSGLHDSTNYVIRAGQEYSDEFDLAIGFREGCPSSPVCFSLYRNFAIGRFLERCSTQQNNGLHCTVNPIAPINLRRKLAGKPDRLEQLFLHTVLFADGTTGLTRESLLQTFEQNMSDFAEGLHPGKAHRLRAGVAPPAGSAYEEAVKFHGVWLQWDGRHDRDTQERMLAAQRIWHKPHPQLQRLGLTPKQKGAEVSSTVINCLPYGCERRTFTGRQLNRYQTFANRITFALCSQRRSAMQDDQLTLADLRKKCGLVFLRRLIEMRQLQYLGHLARLPDERLEKKIFLQHYGRKAKKEALKLVRHCDSAIGSSSRPS